MSGLMNYQMILINISFADIERLLQMQYNSKLYPELLKVKYSEMELYDTVLMIVEYD
jgi:hypothetical protein